MNMDAKEEIEIDLIRMLKAVLFNFKSILIVGFIFAVLGFSYKFYSFSFSQVPLEDMDKLFKIERVIRKPDGRTVVENVKVSYNLYKEDYNARLAKYENQKLTAERERRITGAQIDIAKNKYEKQKAYIENSKLYGADPASFWEAEVYYNIREKNSQSAARMNQLQTRLSNADNKLSVEESHKLASPVIIFAEKLLNSREYYNRFAESLGISIELSEEPVTELVVMEPVDISSFRINLKGNSKDVVDGLLKVIKEFDKELSSFFEADYDINSKLLSYTNYYNRDLLTIKNDQDVLLDKLNGEVHNLENQQKNILMPVPLEDDKMIDLGVYRITKLIIFTIAGFIGGMVLAGGYFCLKYLFSGRLNDADYLTRVYGISQMAVVHAASFAKGSESEVRKLANVSSMLAQDYKNVVVVTTLDDAVVTSATDVMKAAFTQASGSFSVIHAEEIQTIKEADAVVVVEKLDVSGLKDVTSEIEFVQNYGKKILGIVYA
ncbi:MAG: hypothetical protein ACI4NE_08535 [Succinivibrio sp.]